MKFLFKPIRPFKINQSFGENKACIDNKTGKVVNKIPFKDDASCQKGTRSVYSNMKGHNGVDLFARRHTPIFSAQDGIVEELVDEPARGLGLGIVTTRKYYCYETKSYEYFKLRYWHNHVHHVRKGDKVYIGDLIATADNTGYSSGDHLHFEMKPVKVKWKEKGKSIKSVSNILQNNGFFGAVDPMRYMREEEATKFMGIKTFRQRLAWMLNMG